MTVPLTYAHAGEDFDRLLVDARDALGLSTRHQTFTVVEAVLWVFRARLDAAQVARFAQVLPAVLRAIFIEGWDPTVPPVPFLDRSGMTRAVQAVRHEHNLAPDDCIRQVAAVLARHVDTAVFRRALASLPPAAAEFWSTADADP